MSAPDALPMRLLRLAGKGLGLLMMGLIRLYQLVLSPYMGRSCRFDPTCSHYGMEAIRRHGPIWGVWLTVRRISRCHPWGGMGYDPVPDDPRPRWGARIRMSENGRSGHGTPDDTGRPSA